MLNSPMVSKYVKSKGFGSINEYINRVIEVERAENGRTVSREHAECELVAHFTTDVLFNRTTDKEIFDEFYTSIYQKHPEQAKGFFAAIKNFLRKICDLVTGHRYDSQFADLERRFSKMVAEVEEKYGSGSDVDANIYTDTQQKTAAEDTAGGIDTNSRIDGEKNYIDITANMSEADRYNTLKDKKIQPQKIEVDNNFDIDFEYLENNIKSIVEKPLIKKLRDLGYLRNYTTSVIGIDFDLTAKGLRKSLHSQTNYYGGNNVDFAKVILNIQKLLDNSVLLEIHTDKSKGTSRENAQLKQTYVLLSAFQEDGYIKPVQFEVKQYIDDNNRLYLAVALTKIETGVKGNTILDKNQASTSLLPISNISLADLFSKINPKDKNFLKYVPNQFLNDEQIEAKNKALQIDREKYSIASDKAELEEKSFLSLDDYVDDDSYERVLKRKNNALQEETESQIVAIHQMFRDGDITESEMLAAENDVMKNLFKKVNKQTHNYVRILRDRNNQRAAAKKTRSEVKGEVRSEMSETERKRILRESIRRRVKTFTNTLNANTNTRNIPDNLKGLTKASIGLINEGRFSKIYLT